MTVEVTAQEHDQQIAKSQAVFHLIAQVMKQLKWASQDISTPGPEAFDRLVRTVQQDTDQLFLDIERENPFAAEWRQRFIQEVLSLDKRLSDSKDEPLCLNAAVEQETRWGSLIALKSFTLLQKIEIVLMSFAGWILLRLIGATLRYRVEGWEPHQASSREKRAVYWLFLAQSSLLCRPLLALPKHCCDDEPAF